MLDAPHKLKTKIGQTYHCFTYHISNFRANISYFICYLDILPIPLGIVNIVIYIYAKVNNESVLVFHQADEATIREYLTLQSIIQSFRMRGHLAATVDPLGITRGEHLRDMRIQQYVLRHYPLPKDMDKPYLLHNSDYIGSVTSVVFILFLLLASYSSSYSSSFSYSFLFLFLLLLLLLVYSYS